MSGAWHYDPVSMDDVWVEDPPVGTNYTDDLPDPNKFPGYTYDPKQGGYTLIDDTGERQTIDQDGNIIRVTDSTGKVVYGTDVTGSSGGIDVSGLAKTLGKTAFDQFKGLFTKKDADGNDVTDWAKVAAAGGALLGASGVLKKPPQLTGYQGGIPTRTAVQQQVPGTYDPTRRPGSSGQRYFTDVIQSAPADVASAKTAVGEQATGLAALNAANPAMQKRPAVTPPAAAPTTTTAAPASSVIDRLAPTAKGLESLVNPPTQTPSPKPAPQYDPNDTRPIYYRDPNDGTGGPAMPNGGWRGGDIPLSYYKNPSELAVKGVEYGSKDSAPTDIMAAVKAANPNLDWSKYNPNKMTMDYDQFDAARDDYMRAANPTFNQNKESDMAKAANAAQNAQSGLSSLPKQPPKSYTNPSDFEGLNFASEDSAFGGVNYKEMPMFHYAPGTSKEQQLRQEAPYMTRGNYEQQLNYMRGREQPSVAPPPPPQQPQEINYASGGGITALKRGNYLSGPTDGMADKLPANIEGNQEARLSHGEFVIPADVVSHLGNGNSDAGADRLYSMMDKIRKARTGTKKQGKQINPNKFLPGGSVGYAEGGIKGFAGETGSKVTVPANAIGAESNLSNWAGPYVTDMLGKGAALANTPYQSYSGPLTAGASAGQTAAFDASAGLNIPTSKMGAFTPQTFTADQAQNYMNPYLSAALNPQMEEMRRQSQLNLQPNMAKLTQAGGFGGSRQALLQSESNRNLQTQQNAELGKGYQTAFDKAMGQFNTEQGRGLDAQTANNAYGLQALSKQAELGGQQRAIEQEGIAADKAQFEEERNDPFTKLTFQQKLLQGLPIQAQSNNYQQSNWLDDAFTAAGGANKFFEKIFSTTPASTTTTVKT